jgi:hypothetical protein
MGFIDDDHANDVGFRNWECAQNVGIPTCPLLLITGLHGVPERESH